MVQDGSFRLSKSSNESAITIGICREARGGKARLEWNQIPRKALQCKARGEQSEDFCAAMQHENQGLFQAFKEVQKDFFESLKRAVLRGAGRLFLRLDYRMAMASISQRTFLGRVLTATQLRAGLEVKYLA